MAILLAPSFVYATCPAGSSQCAEFHVNTENDVPGTAQVCSLDAVSKNIDLQSNAGIGGGNIVNPDCPPGKPINYVYFDKVPTVGGIVNVASSKFFGQYLTVFRSGGFKAMGNARALRLAGTATVILERMKISDGGGDNGGLGGVILVEGGANLSANQVHFIDNHSTAGGGAIAFMSYGRLAVQNYSEFRGNTTDGNGGAILLAGSTPLGEEESLIAGTVFIGNSAVESGGAIACPSPQRKLHVRNTHIAKNEAGTGGAPANGGGIYSMCALEVNKVRLLVNRVKNGRGGGLYAAGPNTFVHDSNISSNIAGVAQDDGGYGGGVFIDGKADLWHSAIYNNKANDEGGGIAVGDAAAGHSVTIANLTIAQNEVGVADVDGQGAGLWITGKGFPLFGPVGLESIDNFRFVALNTTITENIGSEQIYLEQGGSAGELMFVNNIVQSSDVSTCGGDSERLQLHSNFLPDTIFNRQYPDGGCSNSSDQIDVGFVPLAAGYGGFIHQAYYLINSNEPMPYVGDQYACYGLLVGGRDQLQSPRYCLLGATEQPRPDIYPAEFPSYTN